VASCTGAPLVDGFLDTRTVGTHTFRVTATDLAGNQTTKTVTYFVRFAFDGFKPPVDNPPTVNITKAGSTIPLKWRLKNASGQFIYTWRTQKAWAGTCWRVSVALSDDTVRTADFKIK
jgi:hypothetical protein